MPGPFSNKAPSFDGETSQLLEFFEYFEDLADGNSLTDSERCKMLVRYADVTTKRFWTTLDGFDSRDYATLKASILAQYPGASKGTKYTIRDLDRIAGSYSERTISTESDLSQYYRAFRPISTWLLKNNKISIRER
ncbi:hypothetical protein CONPUDRAFT_16488, partial [Coniophora puteana RWD-64-598 SS2]